MFNLKKLFKKRNKERMEFAIDLRPIIPLQKWLIENIKTKEQEKKLISAIARKTAEDVTELYFGIKLPKEKIKENQKCYQKLKT